MNAGPRLVGRDQAQAVIAVSLARAMSGTGGLVLVSGEPGIGKSALLSWLADEAAGATVLRGFCWEGSGAPPYWPWTQVLRAAGRPAAELGEAGRLLDPEPHDDVVGAAAAADAQFRLMQAVTETITRLTVVGPVVLVLDDFQWADPASVQLLSFLTRATVAAPVLGVAAYRDTEATPEVRELATLAEHVPLVGLGRSDVETMMNELGGVATDPAAAETVWQRTGGNPFFVRELTRLLQGHDAARPPPRLPAEVAETVRRRLARLPDDGVRLLEWAAVAGREIEPELLASCTGKDSAEVAQLLAAAVSAGVVLGGDRPGFAHDLYRETLLDGMAAASLARAHLVVGRHLRGQERPGSAARVAAHLAAAGPEARPEAVAASVLAATEATARLGHDDACRHLERALALLGEDQEQRLALLLELAAAQDRAGRRDPARDSLREAAILARARGDTIVLARAALGLQLLGARSGAQVAEVVNMLEEADGRLATSDEHPALRSSVLGALTRAHGHSYGDDADLVALAERAVALAEEADDPAALAAALLAQHDAVWAPGTAERRLEIASRMRDAAAAAGDRDLVAQARQLRATALLELGDPAGRDELLAYVALAENLGHARGRWGALTRQATYAELAGQVEEAVRLADEALALGLAIQEPDAEGCFSTHRGALAAFGPYQPELPIDLADPMWPLFPLVHAWGHAARGDEQAAREVLGSFSVLEIAPTHDLERLAVAAVVFAVVGSDEQRRWTYERLRPHAGTHVIVGGCAAYHAAVDHHLGTLAASLGERAMAQRHFRDAVRMHERLGAAGWLRISQQALADLGSTEPSRNDFRLDDGRWVLSYAGRRVSLPDAKGLHDLHALIGANGADMHVLDLVGPEPASAMDRMGADPVLDDRAKAEYRARLDVLAGERESAERAGDAARSELLEEERVALVRALASATGLGGRDRRLGDVAERARKTVGARIRDSLGKIEQVHPELAAHLRDSLRLGTSCVYRPTEPTAWRLTS
jgi:hypothetical protein